MTESDLANMFMAFGEHAARSGSPCHSLPRGVEAKKIGAPSWHEPAYCTDRPTPPQRDFLSGTPKNRYETLRNALAKGLLMPLIPEGESKFLDILRDSILKSQAVNLERAINHERGPTVFMLDFKW